MLKFIAGIIVGVIVAQTGFTGIAMQLDKGIEYVKGASVQTTGAEQKVKAKGEHKTDAN